MKTFKEAYKLIGEAHQDGTFTTEYDDTTIEKVSLAAKIFEGVYHMIKVNLFDMTMFGNYRIAIYSIRDPKITGYIDYPDKKSVVLAYNYIETLDDLIKYLKKYRNEYTAFWWELILKDEDVKRTEEESSAPPTEGNPTVGAPSIESGPEIFGAGPAVSEPTSPGPELFAPEPMAPGPGEVPPTEAPGAPVLGAPPSVPPAPVVPAV